MDPAELDHETVDQFRNDVGSAALELIKLFAEETRTRLDRMDQLLAENDWAALAAEAHTLKSATRTYGLGGLADISGQLEHACRNAEGDEAVRLLRTIHNNTDTALDALVKIITGD